MAFVFEDIGIDEAREQFATTRDTMLSQVCRKIVAGMEGVVSTPALTLAQLEMMDDDFANWQTRQRDRKSEGEDVQVIDLDGIARKINADKAKTNVRAIRRDKSSKIAFVDAAQWDAAVKAGTESDDDSE
jgi:hypothetical protein